MSISIPDTFEGENELVNYGVPASNVVGAQAIGSTILANKHVDIRTFQGQILVPRTIGEMEVQFSSMGTPGDSLSQTLDNTPMSVLDQEPAVASEGWTLSTTTGVQPTVTTGSIASLGNWFGAIVTPTFTSSCAFSLDSVVPTQPIDISPAGFGGFITLVMPSIKPVAAGSGGILNLANSYIHFTSQATGVFTANGRVSLTAEVQPDLFTSEIRVPISAISGVTTDANGNLVGLNANDFDPTAIIGARIHIETTSTPTTGTFTFLSLRAIASNWQYQTLDLNTKQGSVWTAVNPAATAPSVAQQFVPLVRHDQSGGGIDPKPIDGSLLMFFNAGQLTVGSGTNVNQIDFIFREQFTDALNGDYCTARLLWNATSTQVRIFRTKVVNGAKTESAGLRSYSPPTLLPYIGGASQGWYVFSADLTKSSFTVSIASTDSTGAITPSYFWTNAPASSDTTNFPAVAGRVGWFAKFVDLDAYLISFSAAPTNFSAFTTKPFTSLTPVDGAQLKASFSTDLNLFTSFDGSLDTTFSLSGNGAWRADVSSGKGLTSNQFLIEDWSNTYIDCDIWVPATSKATLQPVLTVAANSQNSAVIATDTFTPGQWSHVTVDLSFLAGVTGQGGIPLITGTSYQVILQQPGSASPYTFWVDNMKVGRRTVAWEMKANQASSRWRPFRSLVNDPTGAVHLPRGERGKALQLQCRALTQEAWVAAYTLIPHYAQLGKPTYLTNDVTSG